MPAYRGQVEMRSQAALRRYVLPASMRQTIGEASVDVYPWLASYVPANGLAWVNRPLGRAPTRGRGAPADRPRAARLAHPQHLGDQGAGRRRRRTWPASAARTPPRHCSRSRRRAATRCGSCARPWTCCAARRTPVAAGSTGSTSWSSGPGRRHADARDRQRRRAAAAGRRRPGRVPDRPGGAHQRRPARRRRDRVGARSIYAPRRADRARRRRRAGVPARRRCPGFGLIGMRERVTALGGALRRREPAGPGTAASPYGRAAPAVDVEPRVIRVAARRRPGADPGRFPRPARRRGRHRGGRRGGRRP